MTDRHAGYVITLSESLREEDSDEIVRLLRRIQGVISVEPVLDDFHIHIARSQARHEMGERLWKVLYDDR